MDMRVHLRLVLALGVGLLAAISPATAQAEEGGARVPVRSEGERYPSRGERDWIRIASPTSTKSGAESIIIGKDAGAFRSLRIEAVSGIVVVSRISVLTYRGSWKTYYVNRRLDTWDPRVYVDLGASTQIAQVVITTDRRFAGSYTIDGSSRRTGPVLLVTR